MWVRVRGRGRGRGRVRVRAGACRCSTKGEVVHLLLLLTAHYTTHY